MIKSDKLADLLTDYDSPDPLVIRPVPNIELVRNSGSASIDLRLGCWFSTLRESRQTVLDVNTTRNHGRDEPALTKLHHVPFGKAFILHPRRFVLGVTLQWIRLPRNIGGYVTSRSSWGRRGLIIATAVGVHPGFAGCLTLELSNVGELPIRLYPGLDICQFFLHFADTTSQDADQSRYIGKRQPLLGEITTDPYFNNLVHATQHP